LVVAPLRVANSTWPTEIKKWKHLDGLTYSVVTGTAKQRREALMKPAFIYITNRENLCWIIDNGYFQFDMLIVDELSSFKDSKTKRFKALKKERGKLKRIVGLTGTPAPNGLEDLWSQVYLLDGGERLGRFITAYREKYFLPDKRNREIIYSYRPRNGAEEAIYEKISDICVSMKSCDHLQDMPALRMVDVEVTMDPKEQELYDRLQSDLILTLDEGDIDAQSAVGLSNKLRQMANGAVYDENGKVVHIHDKKLDALEDIIEAACGKPVLIAYWYKHDRDRLLKRFNAAVIDTPEDIDKWNAGEYPVAIIHPQSAGHGINIQAGGCHMVWYSLTWSLEYYQQCNARLYRQGQKENVTIQHLITKGTIDEDVLAALKKKDCSQEALLSAVKARIGGKE